MKTTLSTLTGLIVTFSLGLAYTAQAATLYRENFGNSTVGYTSFSSIGWSAYVAPTSSGTVANRSTFSNANLGISNQAGEPDDLPNVNASTSLSNSHGFGAIGGGQVGLFFSDSYSIDPSQYEADSITFEGYAAQYRATGTTAAGNVRIALRIGTQWYVSDVHTFTTASTIPISDPPATIEQREAAFSTYALSFSRSLSEANWFTLGFTLGSAADPFTRSSVAVEELPEGSITAFGFFVQAPGSGSTFFDTFSIKGEAVPEPASMALLGGGFLIYGWSFVSRRFRKKERSAAMAKALERVA